MKERGPGLPGKIFTNRTEQSKPRPKGNLAIRLVSLKNHTEQPACFGLQPSTGSANSQNTRFRVPGDSVRAGHGGRPSAVVFFLRGPGISYRSTLYGSSARLRAELSPTLLGSQSLG